MVVHDSDLKSESRKPAMILESILVFGSKALPTRTLNAHQNPNPCFQGCGKTALLNSFVQGNRDVSSFSAPHGEASHVVVESVQVEDGDLGPNEGHEYHIMT